MKPLPHRGELGITYTCQFCISSYNQFGALENIPPGSLYHCFLKGLSKTDFCLPIEVRTLARNLTDRIDLLFTEWSKNEEGI